MIVQHADYFRHLHFDAREALGSLALKLQVAPLKLQVVAVRLRQLTDERRLVLNERRQRFSEAIMAVLRWRFPGHSSLLSLPDTKAGSTNRGGEIRTRDFLVPNQAR